LRIEKDNDHAMGLLADPAYGNRLWRQCRHEGQGRRRWCGDQARPNHSASTTTTSSTTTSAADDGVDAGREGRHDHAVPAWWARHAASTAGYYKS